MAWDLAEDPSKSVDPQDDGRAERGSEQKLRSESEEPEPEAGPDPKVDGELDEVGDGPKEGSEDHSGRKSEQDLEGQPDGGHIERSKSLSPSCSPINGQKAMYASSAERKLEAKAEAEQEFQEKFLVCKEKPQDKPEHAPASSVTIVNDSDRDARSLESIPEPVPEPEVQPQPAETGAEDPAIDAQIGVTDSQESEDEETKEYRTVLMELLRPVKLERFVQAFLESEITLDILPLVGGGCTMLFL